ncbi:MAG: TlyA family RNA methyltransferase [Myxococcota bacterium]
MKGDVLWALPGSPSEKKVLSPGEQLPETSRFRLKTQPRRFVSRAGEKLAAGLDAFSIDVADKSAVDIGISTGGFTDCLLQRGVSSVLGVDVAYGILAQKVRLDPRVRLLERTNARHLDAETAGGPFDVLVADVSFISLRTLMPTFRGLLRPGGDAVLLVKPQFEASPEEVDGGILRSTDVSERIVRDVTQTALDSGFSSYGHIPSPILGSKGNQEYLLGLHLAFESF